MTYRIGQLQAPIRASTIKAYARCPRYGRLSELDTGVHTSPSAELGTRVHAVIEEHLKDGTPIDPFREEGQIALAGARHWPARDTIEGLEVRWERGDMAAPHVLQGTIDMITRGVVWDHKTSSNPKRYGLTEASLATDVQAVMYAHAMAPTWQIPVTEIELRWIYYGTRKHESYVVTARPDPTVWTRTILPALDRIAELRERSPGVEGAMGLTPNFAACSDFGGCPFRSNCGRVGVRAALEQGAFKNSLRKTQEDTVQIDVNNIMKQIRSKSIESGVQPQPAPAPVVVGSTVPLETIQTPLESITMGPATVPVQAETPIRPTLETPTRKRANVEPRVAPVVVTEKETEISVFSTPDFAPNFVLYEGCLPVGQPHISAETIIDAACMLVNAQHGVNDYALIEFGKGRGALAAALEGILLSNPPALPVVALRSRRVSDCIEVFRRHASVIVIAAGAL